MVETFDTPKVFARMQRMSFLLPFHSPKRVISSSLVLMEWKVHLLLPQEDGHQGEAL